VHLCIEIGEDECGTHLKQALVLVLLADYLYGAAHLIDVTSEAGLQERAFVREVLVERANGDASACGDARGGQALLADGDQNLNGGLQNGFYRGGGARLKGRLSWVQRRCGGYRQMRTPKLKLSSSKYMRRNQSPLERTMSNAQKLGDSFTLPGTTVTVNRMGYGAMQLAGPHVWGPPKDRAAAVAVLQEAIASGVNHIDTSDFYGPHVTNEIIREALHPYPDDLTIVTKVGGVRGEGGSWLPAQSPAELTSAVEDNLRNLGVDALDVVNLRLWGNEERQPNEESIAERFTALAALREKGLIRHLGLSHVTAKQIAEAETIAPVVCVQNQYNLAQREDDVLLVQLASTGIAYVPYFPLGGFTPLQSTELSDVATELGATPMQVALAWLLQRSPNILLIPGTSSVAHLRENLAAAELTLSQEALDQLDLIGGSAK
jgi:pyridoxine 4-dehydrogenase